MPRKKKPVAEETPVEPVAVIAPPAAEEDLPLPDQPPLDIVLGWLLDAHRPQDVREACRAKFPELDADELLTKADEHFARLAQTCDLDQLFGWTFSSLCDIVRELKSLGDFASAARVIGQINSLAREHVRERDQSETDAETEPAAKLFRA